MNRLGFRFDNLRRSLPGLIGSPNLELAAVYTHFATADEPDSPLFADQRLRFPDPGDQLGRVGDVGAAAGRGSDGSSAQTGRGAVTETLGAVPSGVVKLKSPDVARLPAASRDRARM